MAESPVFSDTIRLRGVRVHNLKNVDVDIPRGALVAICGVSGSGKTSLAIDTLYAEGQRRYIESFSAYTRQFLERIDKPDYDSIDGLTPALAVRRGTAPRGNRSTVGTASETLDYLRLYFAKVAELLCYQCGRPVVSYTAQSVAGLIEQIDSSARLMLAFTTHWEDITERADVLAELQSAGFVRLLAGNRELRLGQTGRDELAESLPRTGSALVVVDRLRGGDDSKRSTESLEIAMDRGQGSLVLLSDQPLLTNTTEADNQAEGGESRMRVDERDWFTMQFTNRQICGPCQIEYPPAEPRLFNFNSPLGACTTCEGFGDTIDLDWNRIVPDTSKSIREGAIAPWSTPAYDHYADELLDVADELQIPVDVPFRKLTKRQIKVLQVGAPEIGFEGLDDFFAWLERKKYKMHVRVFLARWRKYNPCPTCNGSRLNELALAYKIQGHSFADLCRTQIESLRPLLSAETLDGHRQELASGPQERVLTRLDYLRSVGLGYLTLDRPLRTLSGGEAQRTALTTALGSSLVNMLYVLDEPSVGLHPHDVEHLSRAIQGLAVAGNTVVMIEHEEALLRNADWLIEVGPEAGSRGGEIVCSAPPSKIKSGKSLTMDYLTGKRAISHSSRRREPNKGWIELEGCTGNNLRDVEARFPLGLFCMVTGVSGSGKSTLVQDTLHPALVNRLTSNRAEALPFSSIRGVGQIDECILVDQNPISRSPRSNPVTYVKAFDEIRSVFAGTQQAKIQNLSPGHFSFNSAQGRCPTCKGDGSLEIDMQFLADVSMICPDCHGSRYRAEILQVKVRDRSIADVMQMTIRDASHFFRGSKKVQQKLQVLLDVGLGYLQLGQPAPTLSAGEAQRLKLATHLATATRKRVLFLLDEPTTGLHTHDLLQLLDCFNALIEAGHSLLVVEHNLHLMAAADYILDLGPGPAEAGGKIVVAGTPEQVSACSESATGRYLKQFLAQTAGS